MALLLLRWVLHSACHVLGYEYDPKNDVVAEEVKQKQKKNDDVVVGVGYPAGKGRGFQMPLHYPRYRKEEYEKMEEWKVDLLLQQYGLCFKGTLQEKRTFAMGAFLWPH